MATIEKVWHGSPAGCGGAAGASDRPARAIMKAQGSGRRMGELREVQVFGANTGRQPSLLTSTAYGAVGWARGGEPLKAPQASRAPRTAAMTERVTNRSCQAPTTSKT